MLDNLYDIVKERILVLDGAMGTMIQQCGLIEEDFRGERFTDLPGLQKGNNDLLCLSRPEVIAGIHNRYRVSWQARWAPPPRPVRSVPT